MRARLDRLALSFVVAAFVSASAYAQGTRSTLAGVVTDAGGGVLPGVTVVVTSEQTGTKLATVTNERGIYSVPALDAGTYAVTFTLSGFKTTTATKAAVVAGSPASLNVTMDVGAMEETVNVSATSEMVQTQTTTVATIMAADTLKNMPFVTRNLMDSMTYLVGVDRPAAGGDSRDARVNGLPGQSIALTMDGVSIKSAQGEADFYAYVFPTIDSVEQVTVTGATQGADSSGGSASVRFVTRSGSQRYSGSFFDYFRHEILNSNYYFNTINSLPKNRMSVSQLGATIGGPFMRGREAFFFVSWEELVQPISETNTRTILSSEAQQGLFRYDVGGTIRGVDLYALAARNGQHEHRQCHHHRPAVQNPRHHEWRRPHSRHRQSEHAAVHLPGSWPHELSALACRPCRFQPHVQPQADGQLSPDAPRSCDWHRQPHGLPGPAWRRTVRLAADGRFDRAAVDRESIGGQRTRLRLAESEHAARHRHVARIL